MENPPFDTYGCRYYDNRADILKHSFNIIDLIEKGDYVNGFEVSRKDGDVVVVLDFFGQTRGIESKNIKSIVTKEQFESMSYKIGD